MNASQCVSTISYRKEKAKRMNLANLARPKLFLELDYGVFKNSSKIFSNQGELNVAEAPSEMSQLKLDAQGS